MRYRLNFKGFYDTPEDENIKPEPLDEEYFNLSFNDVSEEEV